MAAVVNDEVITLTEVYAMGGDFITERASTPDGRREAELEVLNSLIMRRLISQEITRLELDVTEIELDRTIDDIARRNGLDRAALQGEVEASGLPWDEYRGELRENLRQMKFSQSIIRPRITVDEDQLKDAYRRLVSSADLPQTVELGAIFLPTTDPADETVAARVQAAQERIAAGESFSAVAAELDEGPGRDNGGHIGAYRPGELVSELDVVAFALAVGETSAPVHTPQGIFLLHVFEKTVEDAAPFEQVRDQLFEQVYAGSIEEETEQWYEQARRRAAVLIKLE